MWRGGVLILALAFLGPVGAQEPAAAPVNTPARPAVTELRQDLQQILARPEYQQRGPDWLMDLKLKLLHHLYQWWMERVAPVFANLYEAKPVVFWVIVAAVHLVLIALLYHIYIGLRSAFGTGSRWRRQDPAAALPERVGGPDDLLRRADEAAGEGQFALAFRWLYLALIRRLDQQDLVRFDAAATNYDYLRQVRGNAAVAEVLEPLTRAVEPVWYGYRQASTADYERCREWVTTAWSEGESHAAS